MPIVTGLQKACQEQPVLPKRLLLILISHQPKPIHYGSSALHIAPILPRCSQKRYKAGGRYPRQPQLNPRAKLFTILEFTVIARGWPLLLI